MGTDTRIGNIKATLVVSLVEKGLETLEFPLFSQIKKISSQEI